MAKLNYLVLLLGAAADVAAAAWRWPGTNWTWDRLNIATWGLPVRPAARFNATEIAFKSRFDIIFVDNLLNYPGCVVDSPENCRAPNRSAAGLPPCDTLEQCLAYRSSVAAPLKVAAAAGRAQKVLGYRGIVIAWWNYVTAEHASWWLRDPVTGDVREGVLDWRVPAAAQYYEQYVLGPGTYTDPHIDGVFVDSGFGVAGTAANLTLAEREDLMRAELAAFARMATRMAAHGKVLVVSLKSHFADLAGGDAGGEANLCPPGMDRDNRTRCWPLGGEAAYFDALGATRGWIPFRQYNIPSRDFGKDGGGAGGNTAVGCAAAIEDLAAEGARGPSFATNNDGAPDDATFPNSTLTHRGQHLVSLAAYMLAAAEGSYFSSGSGWSDAGNMVWWPEYDRRVGAPRGPFVRDGFVFRRSFEHVDVSLDCAKVQTQDAAATTFVWR
jgi:hypothetical protein